MNYKYSSRWGDDGDGNEASQMDGGRHLKMTPSLGLAVLALTFSVDSYNFLINARSLEQKVVEQEEVSEGQGTERPAGPVPGADTAEAPTETINAEGADFVKMSRSIDDAFSCSSDSASSTFFVCLLYALFSIPLGELSITRAV